MDSALLTALISSTVAMAVPLLLAGLGELIAERAGVLNIGLEGMMLIGAVFGSWGSQHIGGTSWFVVLASVLLGALAAAVLAAIYAFLAITLKVNQTVAGLALTIFAGGVGLSSYLANTWKVAVRPTPHPIRKLDVFGLAKAPIVGPLLFNHTALTYVSWLFAIGASYYLFRTRMGLHLRAVGESPQTADAMGVNVTGYRYVHTIIGGALAGVGGVVYSLAIVPTWVDGLTKGVGWIAIALVIFGFWRPDLTLLGAYLFGGLSSLSLTLKARNVHINGSILDALPFAATVVVLVILSTGWARKRLGAPSALGVAYQREER